MDFWYLKLSIAVVVPKVVPHSVKLGIKIAYITIWIYSFTPYIAGIWIKK